MSETKIPLTRIVEELAIAAGWKVMMNRHFCLDADGSDRSPARSHDDAIALQDELVERYGDKFFRQFGYKLDDAAELAGIHVESADFTRWLLTLSCEARLRALHAAFPKCQECGGVGRVIGTFGEELIECPACNGSGVAMPGGGK